ncbi:hypothetical protein BAU15_14380 [Enterococcus sp. JM4C]|uniref:CAP-associated domain-containing protein n=1 Tax=Candidatus Enterococcus huntleyi TaxID=1857217 RepID=UPI0013796A22|nr:CAP-associated domain-containing protein [Enterococcus sp. JM4C]KAF1296887.1 hypothetical protein BAU15_14380 [Enterococcus sp. JM4C]
MKRVGLFMSIFMTVLLVFYFEPIVFKNNSEKAVRTGSETVTPLHNTTLKYEELPAEGFSSYINKEVSELEKVLGQPEGTYSTGFHYEVRRYKSEKQTAIIEANITDGKVSAIKAIGDTKENIRPFSYKMTMGKLSELTMIYPNFSFDYKDDTVNIELMEEDMNYRPLIAFDNQTFAILFFDQNDGELFGVTYLSQQELLTLRPYQIEMNTPPRLTAQGDDTDWQAINDRKEAESFETINFLRKLDQLPAYESAFQQQQLVKAVQTDFLAHIDEILDEQRVHYWQQIESGESSQIAFSMSSEELATLVKRTTDNPQTGILSAPIFDPTFSLLYWYSDPFLHTRFMHTETEQLGISFSKENMVVLMQRLDENDTKDSGF